MYAVYELETSNFICMFRMTNSITENKIMIFVEADSTPGYSFDD